MQLAIYKLEDDTKPLCFLSEGEHSLGRGPQLACLDKRISRNHVSIVMLTSTATFSLVHHTNPCYWRCAESKHISLLKPNVPMDINNGDTFGFFPDIFWFKFKFCEAEISNNNDDALPSSSTSTLLLPSTSTSPSTSTTELVNVKQEVVEDQAENNVVDGSNIKIECDSTTNNVAPTSASIIDHQYAKIEDDQPSCSNTANATANDVKKAFKDRCWYGDNCYRKNQEHRDDYSHPGDPDYETDPEDDRPACPYGRSCFRRNKDHRKEYKHSDQAAAKARLAKAANTTKTTNKRPADDDSDEDDDANCHIDQNNVVPTKRKRKETKTTHNHDSDDDDDDDEDDEEDAFATDEDDDYVLSDSD